MSLVSVQSKLGKDFYDRCAPEHADVVYVRDPRPLTNDQLRSLSGRVGSMPLPAYSGYPWHVVFVPTIVSFCGTEYSVVVAYQTLYGSMPIKRLYRHDVIGFHDSDSLLRYCRMINVDMSSLEQSSIKPSSFLDKLTARNQQRMTFVEFLNQGQCEGNHKAYARQHVVSSSMHVKLQPRISDFEPIKISENVIVGCNDMLIGGYDMTAIISPSNAYDRFCKYVIEHKLTR